MLLLTHLIPLLYLFVHYTNASDNYDSLPSVEDDDDDDWGDWTDGEEDVRRIPESLLELCEKKKSLEEKYVLGEWLGEGAYGKVYRAQVVDKPEQQVAVKLLDLNLVKEESYDFTCKQLEIEIDILKKLQGLPNVLQVIEVYGNEINNTVSIVTQLIEGHTLLDIIELIQDNKGMFGPDTKLFPIRVIARIAKELLGALLIMHTMKISHQDLKPDNVMLKGGVMPEAILIDFGMAHQFDLEHPSHNDVKGTPSSMAPETLLEKTSTVAVDIWSLGILLLEMATGSLLMEAKDLCDAQQKIEPAIDSLANLDLGNHPEEVSLRDFILACLRRDLTKRATAAELLNHPFLRNAANQQEMVAFVNAIDELTPKHESEIEQ